MKIIKKMSEKILMKIKKVKKKIKKQRVKSPKNQKIKIII